MPARLMPPGAEGPAVEEILVVGANGFVGSAIGVLDLGSRNAGT